VLELAGRLDNGGDLTYAIQQNLSWLSRQPQGKPGRPIGIVDYFVGLFGVFAGGAIGVALTFPFMSGTEADAFVWGIMFMFLGFIGALLGGGVAVLLRRLWLWVDRIDPPSAPIYGEIEPREEATRDEGWRRRALRYQDRRRSGEGQAESARKSARTLRGGGTIRLNSPARCSGMPLDRCGLYSLRWRRPRLRQCRNVR
jgi:hypothetical protein